MYLRAVLMSPLLTTRRPTGWHGEGGAVNRGGHLTVDFYTADNFFMVTHHVYSTNAAYYGKFIESLHFSTDIYFYYEGYAMKRLLERPRFHYR